MSASTRGSEDGVEVIATGRLTTYAGRSSYQIVIETMEAAGLNKYLFEMMGMGVIMGRPYRAFCFMRASQRPENQNKGSDLSPCQGRS